jgi:hypothetical protein
VVGVHAHEDNVELRFEGTRKEDCGARFDPGPALGEPFEELLFTAEGHERFTAVLRRRDYVLDSDGLLQLVAITCSISVEPSGEYALRPLPAS